MTLDSLFLFALPQIEYFDLIINASCIEFIPVKTEFSTS